MQTLPNKAARAGAGSLAPRLALLFMGVQVLFLALWAYIPVTMEKAVPQYGLPLACAFVGMTVCLVRQRLPLPYWVGYGFALWYALSRILLGDLWLQRSEIYFARTVISYAVAFPFAFVLRDQREKGLKLLAIVFSAVFFLLALAGVVCTLTGENFYLPFLSTEIKVFDNRLYAGQHPNGCAMLFLLGVLLTLYLMFTYRKKWLTVAGIVMIAVFYAGIAFTVSRTVMVECAMTAGVLAFSAMLRQKRWKPLPRWGAAVAAGLLCMVVCYVGFSLTVEASQRVRAGAGLPAAYAAEGASGAEAGTTAQTASGAQAATAAASAPRVAAGASPEAAAQTASGAALEAQAATATASAPEAQAAASPEATAQIASETQAATTTESASAPSGIATAPKPAATAAPQPKSNPEDEGIRSRPLEGNIANLTNRTAIYQKVFQFIRLHPSVLLTGMIEGDIVTNMRNEVLKSFVLAHNGWLQVLLTAGLPGLLASLYLTWLSLKTAARALLLRQSETTFAQKMIALLPLLLVINCVTECVLFVEQFSPGQFAFLMCLGYALEGERAVKAAVRAQSGSVSGRR